ncbi:hypothetical protein EBU71_16380 [bacterium]|nr:hypothetical protein [Candidatus Elulimicrobium humile]
MLKLDRKKIIIWGHPPHTHTHSYIHHGFYKSLYYLGHDVYWVDDIENNNIDVNDAIVISESQAIKHLPMAKSAKYLIHNYKNDFEESGNINVFNFLVYHKNYNWGQAEIEKIDDYSWYDKKTKTPVIMWATDLLPVEIDNIDPVLYYPSTKDVFFVGTVQGKNLRKFARVCANNGKNFINLGGYTGLSDDENNTQFFSNRKSLDAIRNSYISFDVREDCHLDNGYIPCRIFKNMSYGKWTGSNSLKLKEFFDERLTINKNLNILYIDLVEDYKKCTFNLLKDNMNYIRDNHTYLSRLNSILSII